eukprot:6424653-Alexandrium_andersonii.AAC.1
MCIRDSAKTHLPSGHASSVGTPRCDARHATSPATPRGCSAPSRRSKTPSIRATRPLPGENDP